jgi:hypothetical protein
VYIYKSMLIDPFRTTAMMFVLIVILVFIIKPTMFFGPKGHMKPFGFDTKQGETPITINILVVAIIVGIYLLTLYVNLLKP